MLLEGAQVEFTEVADPVDLSDKLDSLLWRQSIVDLFG